MPHFEPNKPEPPQHDPYREVGMDHAKLDPKHYEHEKPVDRPQDKPSEEKPQDEKTAGDLRKEDQEAEIDQFQGGKEARQDEADVEAMVQYEKEQLKEFPPDSDPLKDREDRHAEDKKHDHGAAQEAKDQKQQLADDKEAQKHKL